MIGLIDRCRPSAVCYLLALVTRHLTLPVANLRRRFRRLFADMGRRSCAPIPTLTQNRETVNADEKSPFYPAPPGRGDRYGTVFTVVLRRTPW